MPTPLRSTTASSSEVVEKGSGQPGGAPSTLATTVAPSGVVTCNRARLPSVPGSPDTTEL